MPALKPALRMALGNESLGFVVAVADISEPTVAELTATGGFNLSCSSFAEQELVTPNTEKLILPRLLCEVEQYQVNGPTTYEMADLMISFQPQAASGSDGKKAWETLADGIDGFLWYRQGIKADTDVEAGQFANIIPVNLGPKMPSKTSTGNEAVYAFTQPASITGRPAWNVAVA